MFEMHDYNNTSKNQSKYNSEIDEEITQLSRNNIERFIHELSPRMRLIYNQMSPDRQREWIRYIIDSEYLDNYKTVKKRGELLNRNDMYLQNIDMKDMDKAKTLKDVISCVRKSNKKRKKFWRKFEKEKKKSLTTLINPDVYDAAKISVEEYRKKLKKAAKKESKKMTDTLDCTLEGYRKALKQNKNIDDEFFFKQFGI